MKKHVILGIILVVVGISGLVFCILFGRNVDKGISDIKSWSVSEETLENLTLDSDYAIDIQLEQSGSDESYITLAGHFSQQQLDMLEKTKITNETLKIVLEKQDSLLDKLNVRDFGVKKMTIHLAGNSELDSINLEVASGNIQIDKVKGKYLKVALDSGLLEIDGDVISQTDIVSKSATTEVLNSVGNINIVNDSGISIVKNSQGNVKMSSKKGELQSHRNKSKQTTMSSISGKIVATENSIDVLQAKTTSGESLVNGLNGSLAIQSTSGKILLKEITGTTTASTDAGEIILDQQQVKGNIRTITNSGLIKMTLTSRFQNASFDLASGKGEILAPVNIGSTGGLPKIEAKSKSGDIKIFFEDKEIGADSN